MSYLPIASDIAKDATARLARSALPDAPVLPDREPAPSRPRLAGIRTLASGLLRRLACTIEPTPVCRPQ